MRPTAFAQPSQRLSWLMLIAGASMLAAGLVAASQREARPAKHPVCLFSAGTDDDAPAPSPPDLAKGSQS